VDQKAIKTKMGADQLVRMQTIAAKRTIVQPDRSRRANAIGTEFEPPRSMKLRGVGLTLVLVALSRTAPVDPIDDALLSLLVWTSLALVVAPYNDGLPVAVARFRHHRAVNKLTAS